MCSPFITASSLCCMHKSAETPFNCKEAKLNDALGLLILVIYLKLLKSAYKPENIKRWKFQIGDKIFGPIIEARQLINNERTQYSLMGLLVDERLMFSRITFFFSQEFLITKCLIAGILIRNICVAFFIWIIKALICQQPKKAYTFFKGKMT